MPGTLYLIDSNVLLRWVKPDERDFARFPDIEAVHPRTVLTKNR